MHVLHDVWANPWRDEMIGPWNCGALVVVFDHPPVLLLLGKRHGEVATDLLVTAPLRERVVWAEIGREAEGKTCTLGSRTADHRHRQPRPPVRRRLGLGGFTNSVATRNQRCLTSFPASA